MKPNVIQVTVAAFTGAIAVIGLSILGLCSVWKIYVEPVMLVIIGNVTVAAVSSLTTLLVGRTVSQLNQQGDTETTMTQTTQTVTKPKVPEEPMPVVVTNAPTEPVPTTEAPKL